MTLIRPALVAALAIVLATGCSGGGGGGGDGAQAAPEGDPNSVLATTKEADTSQCETAPAALVTEVAGKMDGRQLTHAYVQPAGDAWYLAGRIEGPGLLGSDVATYYVTALDGS